MEHRPQPSSHPNTPCDRDPRRESLALVAAALTGIQVGAAIVASRAVVAEIGPWSLACLRYAIAFLGMLPVVVASGAPPRIPPRDLVPICVLGILQMGGLVGLLNLALQTTTASRAALLFTTFPLMTMLVAAALGQERLTVRKTLGVMATIAGIAFVLGDALWRPGGRYEWTGALLVLSAAFVGGLCSVLFRPYLARYPVQNLTAVAMLASAVALLPLLAREGTYPNWAAVGWTGWGLVAFVGLSSTAGFLLWFTALRLTTPTRVTIFLALSPVTSTVAGTWLLGEPLTSSLVVGLAGVAAGLWLATREAPRRRGHS